MLECVVLNEGAIFEISRIHINDVDACLKRDNITSEPSIWTDLRWVLVNNLGEVFGNVVGETWLTWWKLPNFGDPHDLIGLLVST